MTSCGGIAPAPRDAVVLERAPAGGVAVLDQLVRDLFTQLPRQRGLRA